MKHAGIHWPENAGGEHPNVETILGMPGILRGCTLICSPSARYWYGAARGASPLVVWRAIPRQGKLPAQLGWNPRRVANEVLNLWDEQTPAHGGTEWFLPLNELQFSKESGEEFPGYGRMAQQLAGLRQELRRRFAGTNVKLMFPAWVPQDDLERADEWVAEAEAWDAICLHAYGSAAAMEWRYRSYRQMFASHPLFVGEWNANHEGHDEYAALAMWADVANTDTGFLGATYYIWETQNAGEGDLSIWGNRDRYGLFLHPPVVIEPEPEPEPEPMSELPFGIDVSNNNGSIDWAAVANAGVQFAIAKVSEGTWFRDGYFAENWQGMKAQGILRGAYHFAQPSVRGAVDEARYFVQSIELLGQTIEPGDVLALDLEDENAHGDLSDWALQWLQTVESMVGFKPLIYCRPDYIRTRFLANRPELAEYGLWLASWGVPTPPQAAPPWDLVAIHQYGVGGPGSVPGVRGECDLNRFNGPIDNFVQYGKPFPEPQPEPSRYVVGSGILVRMEALGDTPASNEVYSLDWSEAFGMSGRRYVYLPATNTVYVYEPS